MGTTNSKEEIIVPQNAAGGNNIADIRQLAVHASTTNIILIVVLLITSLAFLYGVYKIYKNCHQQWITNEIRNDRLRYSIRRRRVEAEPEQRANTRSYRKENENIV